MGVRSWAAPLIDKRRVENGDLLLALSAGSRVDVGQMTAAVQADSLTLQALAA